MEIKILELIDGAKQAQGLTVIIDVFRAFSAACYMINNGAKRVIPVGKLKTAYQLKEKNPDFILVGERDGKIQPGFNYGNSPSQIENVNLKNKTIIHTTSAGTQGIANAGLADEIITGSFVNVQAIINYIKDKKPEILSLVAMGNAGIERADEDLYCAKYIKDTLVNDFPPDKSYFENIKKDLKSGNGRRFFDPEKDWSPARDFELCLDLNKFNFILKALPYKNNLVYLHKGE